MLSLWFGLGKEFECGGGNNAQCSFAADKKMAQIVAGRVFVQGLKVGNQFAVW